MAGPRKIALTLGLVLLSSLLVPASAFANMGPPGAFLAAGAFLISMIEAVIVAVETPILRHRLALSLKRAFVAALAGNFVSTLVGIPFALVVGNNLPIEFNPAFELFWTTIFPRDSLIIVSVYFIGSFLVEWPIVRLITRLDWRRTAAAVALANLVTHVGLLVLMLAGEL